MIDFDHYLARESKRVNEALERYMPAAGQPLVIYEAMRYSVEAGGKRLRPILTLAAAETLGAAGEEVIEVACAVEMIHTYSLIHDDLPAMDNSDLRRGKPTCHRVYGEAVAVLAGDALLTLAFELLARFGLAQNRAKAALQISLELARSAGVEGMIGGQVLDLEAEGVVLPLEELERLHRLKTGTLLRAAAICGALAANASPAQLAALSGYASSLGLAFQIVDDLLDREGTAAELGKQPGSDQARGKATYPALLGAAAASRRAEELYWEAITFLDALNRPAGILSELARRLVFRKK
ncbi:MAG: polyprenyl synthetase family protein [Bacillota bacterium]